MKYNIWETEAESLTEDEIKLYGMVNAVYGLGDYLPPEGRARVHGYVPDFADDDKTGMRKSRPPVGWTEMPFGAYSAAFGTEESREDKFDDTRRKRKNAYKGFLSGALDVYENAANAATMDTPFIDDMYSLMDKVMKDKGADELGIREITFHYDFEYKGAKFSYDRFIGSFGSEELLALKNDYEGTKARIEEAMNNTVLPSEKFAEPESIARIRKLYGEDLTMPEILEKLDDVQQLDDFRKYLEDCEKKVDDFWNIDNVQYFSYKFWDKNIDKVVQNMENLKTVKAWQEEIGYYDERKKDEKMKQAAQNKEESRSDESDVSVAPSGVAAVLVSPEAEKYLKGIYEELMKQNKLLEQLAKSGFPIKNNGNVGGNKQNKPKSRKPKKKTNAPKDSVLAHLNNEQHTH